MVGGNAEVTECGFVISVEKRGIYMVGGALRRSVHSSGGKIGHNTQILEIAAAQLVATASWYHPRWHFLIYSFICPCTPIIFRLR